MIEEGLNGRTATLESPVAPWRNGLDYLGPCLESHAPLDAVLIALGTNELAERYSLTPTDIARACGRLAYFVAPGDAIQVTCDFTGSVEASTQLHGVLAGYFVPAS